MHTTPELREGSLPPMVVTAAEIGRLMHTTPGLREGSPTPISPRAASPPHSLSLSKRVAETQRGGSAGGAAGIEKGFSRPHATPTSDVPTAATDARQPDPDSVQGGRRGGGVGWRVVAGSGHVEPHVRSFCTDPSRRYGRSVRPHLLLPPADGGLVRARRVRQVSRHRPRRHAGLAMREQAHGGGLVARLPRVLSP